MNTYEMPYLVSEIVSGFGEQPKSRNHQQKSGDTNSHLAQQGNMPTQTKF